MNLQDREVLYILLQEDQSLHSIDIVEKLDKQDRKIEISLFVFAHLLPSDPATM